MNLIDTHNHLEDNAFTNDRLQVIQNSLSLGVIRQIMIAIHPDEWIASHTLSLQHDSLYYACGYHPLFLPDITAIDTALDNLAQYLEQHHTDHKLCAIGEIGLDYFPENQDKLYQINLFTQQLNLAKRLKKPVLLHIRKAHADTITILKEITLTQTGIIHAFSGSYEEAKSYIDLGFKLGLGGAGTWSQAKRMHRVLKALPLDAIVLETDAPFMPPSGYKGQRNSPELLPIICRLLAEIKGVTPEVLAEQTTKNACQVFNWTL